jgi:hypothetical protein
MVRNGRMDILGANRLGRALYSGMYTMFAFTAEPGSKSDEALKLLTSWTATLDEAKPSRMLDLP